MATQTSIQNYASGGNFLKFLTRLTEPTSSVTEPAIRRRIHILASLLLVVIPFGIIGVLSSSVLAPAEDVTERLTTIISTSATMLIFLFGYFLVRTKYYMWGAVLTVGYLVLSTFLTVWSIPANINPVLGYLSLAVLLGGILFSVRYTLLLVGITTTAGFLLPVLHPDISFTDAINILVFNLIISGLISLLVVLRERDINQIEQQTLDLAKAVQDAQTANLLKDQFLATMSHELRTPLNAIIGFAEVMLMGLAGEMTEKGTHTTRRIHYNSQRLLQLIDDLLDISKIEAGRIDLAQDAFVPQTLLDSLERTVNPMVADKGIKLNLMADPNLPKLLVGDTQRLGQILINLTTNAIKFTDEGSVNVSLRAQDEETWVLEVKDTGVGIPSHAQEFIFDKFRQVDGSSRRAYSGAGLGLAIVKELAVLMHGNVKLSSKVNEGSTFTVTLPIKRASEK